MVSSALKKLVVSIAPVLLVCSKTNAYSPSMTRRGWIAIAKTKSAASLVFASGAVPSAANAVVERNEALCATGFFVNIYQYKCTDIGDIEEDGKAKELSNDENSSVNSLMGKLGLDESTSFVSDKTTSTNSDVTKSSQGSK
jgi:hypothetical protein